MFAKAIIRNFNLDNFMEAIYHESHSPFYKNKIQLKYLYGYIEYILQGQPGTILNEDPYIDGDYLG